MCIWCPYIQCTYKCTLAGTSLYTISSQFQRCQFGVFYPKNRKTGVLEILWGFGETPNPQRFFLGFFGVFSEFSVWLFFFGQIISFSIQNSFCWALLQSLAEVTTMTPSLCTLSEAQELERMCRIAQYSIRATFSFNSGTRLPKLRSLFFRDSSCVNSCASSVSFTFWQF